MRRHRALAVTFALLLSAGLPGCSWSREKGWCMNWDSLFGSSVDSLGKSDPLSKNEREHLERLGVDKDSRESRKFQGDVEYQRIVDAEWSDLR